MIAILHAYHCCVLPLFSTYSLRGQTCIINVFFIIFYPQPARDSSGAAIALFTARLHNPLFATHQSVLKGLVFQLDATLQK